MGLIKPQGVDLPDLTNPATENEILYQYQAIDQSGNIIDGMYGYDPNPYDQLVNYTMLYDEGDECTAVTGGWSGKRVIPDYGDTVANYEKKTGSLYCSNSNTYRSAGFFTNNEINMSNYVDIIFNISNLSTTSVAYVCLVNNSREHVSAETTIEYLGPVTNNGYEQGQVKAGLNTLNVESLTSNLYVGFGCWGNSSPSIEVSNIIATKEDDWSTLGSKIGVTSTNINTLLTASATLLTNEDAVWFMTKQCTGEFMFTAVQNSTFINSLNNSPYKSYIQSNEHWAKALSIVA